jgi:hypothetical protein
MYDTELQYHLNFRQKDFYAAAKEARLARIAQAGSPKRKRVTVMMLNLVKLSISVLLIYELAVMIYG